MRSTAARLLRFIVPSLAAVTLALSAGCVGSKDPAAKVEDPLAAAPTLPNTVVTGLDGKARGIAEITNGKVAVIDLWASWCTGCRVVSARVAELAERYKSHGDLVVIGLDEGEDRETVSRFLEASKPPHEIYVDPDFTFADALGAREIPMVVVVARDGRILRVSHKLDVEAIRIIDAELANEPAKPAGPEPAKPAGPEPTHGAAP